ncbi:glycoside hydrolase family 99 protein [Sphingobacterium sp. HMA12]|uniref:glycoside hydrolase family 99 protein n=1 Tax=Sphingobacterium sp. HMA12 TaxID=2050894 RepID=UPI000CE9B899|nr:glycoside hydrolase family 99 protein [Sphingobacterium sp. HMA12]
MKKRLLTICFIVFFALASTTGCSSDREDNLIPELPDTEDDGQLDYKTIGFYYDWYGNEEFDGAMQHWAHAIIPNPNGGSSLGSIPGTNGNIASNFYPELGAYSSRDPEIVKKHMEMFKKARIGVASISWWNEKTDAEAIKNLLVLNEAEKVGVKVCFHLEPYAGRNPESLRENIKKLIDTYGSHPAFFRVDGKPMFFIYDSYNIEPNEWAKLLSPDGALTIRNTPYDSYVIGLWLNDIKEQGQAIIDAHFDGFYTYFSSLGFNYGSTPTNWVTMQKWANDNNKIFIPSVGPGYIDTRVRPWNTLATRNRNDGKYYDVMYRKAIEANTPYISITSFNEWHEGSQIEPAIPQKNSAFTYLDYGGLAPDYYLTRTAYWVKEFRKK